MRSSGSGIRIWSAALALAGWLVCAAAGAADPGNRVENGGFEKGDSGWQWEQWKGRPLPGHIDREDMAEGRASFKFHDPDVRQERYMAIAARIDPGRDYVLSIALKPQQLPEGAARVRVLVDGRGWYGRESGRFELVQTGGTHGWKTYSIPLAAASLGGATKVTIFVLHGQADRGALGIDAVSLKPATAASDATPAQDAGRPGKLKAVTYDTSLPVLLVERPDAPVAIQVSPDQALYRTGELPRVTIRTTVRDGTVAYRVIDGFGQVLANRAAPAAPSIDVPLPPGHGYYEIVATLTRGGQMLGEGHHSLGALPPPAPPVGDEPFGLWIQGQDYYPELGVRWTRDGVDWNSYRARGDRYLEDRIKFYQWCKKNHIRVLAFPKGHPHQTSREVIADTPEAWRAEEEWWTKMVRTLAPHVDAWGLINEPMRDQWQGSDELIVRYWTLMRRIVDRYDPGKPLIGPSLNPNAPRLVEQYRDLLGMGFGRLVDAVEMHTYINSPEDNDWEGNTRRIREMTRAATGKDLPVWSTEHGTTATPTYDKELLQAQHLMRSFIEAKKIGYPVVIWHMFSWPQGADRREVLFGIFRNFKNRSEAAPQPRPAAIAYGVMTRQLAGARYRGSADHFGPAVRSYIFERHGKAMMALWTTSQKTYDVTLSTGDETKVTTTGLFGRVQPLDVRDGLVRVRVDRNPQFISPLPASYLQTEPVGRLGKAIEVLPGQSAQVPLMLANPTQRPAVYRLEWQPAKGWEFNLPQQEWSLDPNERKSVPLTVTAASNLPAGQYQLYAKVFRDGRYLAPITAAARILPKAMIVRLEPSIVAGRPALTGTVRRLDPGLEQATVKLEGSRATQVVAFQGRHEAVFVLLVDNPRLDRLSPFKVAVHGVDGTIQNEESLRASFVAAGYAQREPTIDGDLSDWPELASVGGDGGFAVRWRWDEHHLYLAVRVRDPTHIQNQPSADMWKEDSLQVALGPGQPTQLGRSVRPDLQETDMTQLDVALRRQQAVMFRHLTLNRELAPTGEVAPTKIRRAVRHSSGVTIYELQIPVEQVGFKPFQAGQVVRASLVLNSNDGDGRRTTEWFGGIRESKDPTLFGHLILIQ